NGEPDLVRYQIEETHPNDQRIHHYEDRLGHSQLQGPDYPGDHRLLSVASGKRTWVVLFSHPADFTPVYTTELGRIDRPLPRVPEAQHQAAGSLVRQALYIIGPDHKLKLAMLHPMSTGRNVEEQGPMRCIDSLRLSSRLPYVAKPANWTPGDKVMFLPEVPEVKESDLKRLFPRGVERVSMPSGIGYVSTTTDNGYKNTSKLFIVKNGLNLQRWHG
ncbi:uncharacterized protein LOC113211240, partial [Frankliniella occidentalis]|uniref:Uncharacterized protein LOC113211240 n=1 Tax=Frankliniella occidentalis TaxID=133901 RepID=A0A9C6WVQ2_FRAOC